VKVSEEVGEYELPRENSLTFCGEVAKEERFFAVELVGSGIEDGVGRGEEARVGFGE
jgi:hypothetical protein